jgi:hypothetical protein
VGFSEIFVEDNDNVIDLLSKFQPDPVWHSRDIIKTPMHCKWHCKLSVLHSCWIFTLFDVATCQGGFKGLLRDKLDAKGHLHLSFSSIKDLM